MRAVKYDARIGRLRIVPFFRLTSTIYNDEIVRTKTPPPLQITNYRLIAVKEERNSYAPTA